MIAAFPQQYLEIILLLSSYCGASVLLRYDDYLLGRQIHLKAIFDISMCHPKVPYHYTFIMTTSRKKSQKFTQTNSKRPSKVKEAGSCLTERRANRVVIHFFLTNAMWQRYRYLSNELITSLKFWREHSNDPLKMHGAKLEAYIKRDGNILLPDKVSCQ